MASLLFFIFAFVGTQICLKISSADPYTGENPLETQMKKLVNSSQNIEKLLADLTSSNKHRIDAMSKTLSLRLRKLITYQAYRYCIHPWTYFRGICLQITGKLTWDKAEQFCKQSYGHLAWFDNQKDHDSVRKFVNKANTHFHIGLHKKNGVLRWSSTTAAVTYSGKMQNSNEKKFYGTTSSFKVYGETAQNVAIGVCRGELPMYYE